MALSFHVMTNDMMASIPQQSPKPRRRWFRFSLRSLLLFVVLVGIPLGWLGSKVNRARKQRAVVAELQKLGARFIYDPVNELGPKERQPSGPTWLIDLLGREYFDDVFQVSIASPGVTDETIELIAELPAVEYVFLKSADGITDDGFVHFANMHNLKGVGLCSDSISGAGFASLKGLKQFTQLSLSAWVTDALVEHISTLPQLEVIYLCGSPEHGSVELTDRGLAYIARLPRLRSLRLENIPWNAPSRPNSPTITDKRPHQLVPIEEF